MREQGGYWDGRVTVNVCNKGTGFSLCTITDQKWGLRTYSYINLLLLQLFISPKGGSPGVVQL